MSEINLSQLSAEQRREMLAQLKAQEEAEKRQREADISTYKALVSQTVEDNFPVLQAVSANWPRKNDPSASFRHGRSP